MCASMHTRMGMLYVHERIADHPQTYQRMPHAAVVPPLFIASWEHTMYSSFGLCMQALSGTSAGARFGSMLCRTLTQRLSIPAAVSKASYCLHQKLKEGPHTVDFLY